MPWKETHVEQERMRFVAACLGKRSDWSMSELSETFGVSRKTGYKWVERYLRFGLEGLKDRSRAPNDHPNRVADEVVKRLITMRRRHRTWGPRKIVAVLERKEPKTAWPAVSTAGEILKRHGWVRSRRRRRRVRVQPTGLLIPSHPNELWSADFKGWFRTKDRQRCDPLTIADGYSRFLLACRAVARADAEGVRPVFRRTFREYGLSLVLRTDNGPPFASMGLGGLTRRAVWWVKLGIRLERIDPGEPQQNGRHERMHETLKRDTARPPRASGRAQQRAFDQFWYVYNFERPHEALQDSPPAQWYAASPRPYPEREPEIDYPGHFEVRRVRHSGEIKWRGERLYVSEALIGETVGLEQSSDRHWRMWFGTLSVGLLDDHTRELLAHRPGAGRKRARRGLA